MRHAFALLLACAVLGLLQGTAAVLVGVGDPWRFTNAVSIATGAPWYDPAYPDSGWPEAPSGFGSATYGEQTSFNALAGDWRNVVFRKSFVLTDTNSLGALLFRVDYRDGFVAYLNGREVLRRNIPTNIPPPVPLNTLPFSRFAGAAEDIRLGEVASLLLPGTNHLAIQVHCDQSWERPILVPELVTDFARGPYLQIRGPNTMTILWRTIDALPGRLYFGTNETPPLAAEFAPSTNLWRTIPGLVPGQTYHYAVSILHPDGTETRSATHRFRALPDSGPVRIQVLGDSGAGTAGQFGVAQTMAQNPADVVLHAGDIVYPYFTEALADTRLLSVYRQQMAGTPFAFAWGNHDLTGGTRALRNVMYPPPNDTAEETHLAEGTTSFSYYSFDAGEVHVAVVFQPVLSQYQFKTNSAQYLWLDQDLARTRKPWKILVAHHPIATSGGHRFSDYNANGIPDWSEFAEVLTPLARRHGVQLYLSGHDHLFERFLPRDGLHSIVTGGGGTPLYYLLGYDDASVQMHITHHFTRIEADADSLHIRAIRPGGTLLDEFVLHRTPPPAPPTNAIPWSTPTLEPPDAAEWDGNVPRQTYDLTNALDLLPFTGKAANLGRIHLALDKTHLYLGLASLMIPRDTDVCLFLEVPGIPGVASLAGLGNGVPDPTGEGVDALDAFENLSFTRFQPAVAVVVGDEFADATLRGFRRPGHLSGLGQGAFALVPGLPSIPGCRLQQFNRSPQDGVAPTEQNADFIEIAIPRSALGNLPAGSEIRLGVVAAGPPDFIQQVRPLDPAYYGASFTSDGTAPAMLEGMLLRLPEDPDPDDDGLSNEVEARLGTDPRLPDSDGDGLPDGWEVRHGLDPRSALGADGSSGDPDKDGFSNHVEWAHGANPRDAHEPSLQLTAGRQADGSIALRWPTLLDAVELQRSDRLDGPWSALEGFPRNGTGTNDIALIPATDAVSFFRLLRR